jgi:hypothetical protein
MELNNSQNGYWRKIQISMGTRLSESLRDEVSKRPLTEADSDSATSSSGVKLAYLVATLVYLSSLAIAIAGIALLAMSGGKLIYLLGGGLCLLVAALSLPRFARVPAKIASREDYPGIYALTDRVAEKLGTEPVSGVGISAEFNANYRSAGWKGGRYVEIGAALAAVLSVEEFVAVVAHEMSHGANGDPLWGKVSRRCLEYGRPLGRSDPADYRYRLGRRNAVRPNYFNFRHSVCHRSSAAFGGHFSGREGLLFAGTSSVSKSRILGRCSRIQDHKWCLKII